MEFGEWLKQKRQALDITQETLAEVVNCAVDTIRKIEAGRRRPSRQLAELLADYFSTSPDERAAFVQRARGIHDRSVDVAEPPFQERDPVVSHVEGAESGNTTVPSQQAGTPTTATAERSSASISPARLTTSSLPFAPTTLIGRERELAEIRSLLWRTATRLVTLVGPSGIGKTRLAQAVAASLQDDFKDGLAYVPLVGVTDPALVGSTLARALGLREGQDTPLEAMQKALSDKQMLLVLDNFEQVVEAADLLADLLASAPQIKILVTSRSPLHLRGEKLVNVPPLPLPSPDHLPPLEELGRIESVALFVERTQDAMGAFALTPENAQLVARICTQLDGLPLAIELAAARTRLLSLTTLNQKLGHQPGQVDQPGHLGLLTGGPRDAPSHQQSLRRAIVSSYTLLGEEEQKLFRGLGIFVGPFNFEAAEAVAEATLESLEAVLNQSLVRRQQSGVSGLEGEVRFSMLASIREYAQDMLVAHGELEEISLKHASYLLDLAVSTRKEATGPNEPRWHELINSWLDDIRSALRWAINSGSGEATLNLTGALQSFWTQGHMAEGRRWFEEALSMNSVVPDEVRAKGLQVASLLAQGQSDYAKSRVYAEESLALYQKLGDKHGLALAFSSLGVVAAEEGDYGHALALLEQSLASWRELGNTYNAGIMLFNMGFMAIRMKDYDRALELSEESLDAFHTLGNPRGITTAKINIGLALLHKGEYQDSLKMHRECLALATELESRREISLSHLYLGLALLAQGDYKQAGEHYRKSLAIAQETDNRFGALRALLGLAGVASGEGRPKLAVRLVSAANTCGLDAAKNSVPAEADLQERILARARATLNDDEFAAAWTVGQGLSVEEAALAGSAG